MLKPGTLKPPPTHPRFANSSFANYGNPNYIANPAAVTNRPIAAVAASAGLSSAAFFIIVNPPRPLP